MGDNLQVVELSTDLLGEAAQEFLALEWVQELSQVEQKKAKLTELRGQYAEFIGTANEIERETDGKAEEISNRNRLLGQMALKHEQILGEVQRNEAHWLDQLMSLPNISNLQPGERSEADGLRIVKKIALVKVPQYAGWLSELEEITGKREILIPGEIEQIAKEMGELRDLWSKYIEQADEIKEEINQLLGEINVQQ